MHSLVCMCVFSVNPQLGSDIDRILLNTLELASTHVHLEIALGYILSWFVIGVTDCYVPIFDDLTNMERHLISFHL